MTRDELVSIIESFEWDIQHYDTNQKIRNKYDGEIDNLWGAIADAILERQSAPITNIRVSKGVARNTVDYLELSNKKDWKFGGKDFTIDAWIRFDKWFLFKWWLQLIYTKYILYPRWKILKYFKLYKVSFEEYLDILSFQKSQ